MQNRKTPYELRLALKFRALKINISHHTFLFSNKGEKLAKDAFLQDFCTDLDEVITKKDMDILPIL
ncbi:MAG: hypothetical protein AAFN93_08790 [Bacteroidota bacterium]